MIRELQLGNNKVRIFNDISELGYATAAFLREDSRRVLQLQQKYYISLGGGSTPKALFRELSTADFIENSTWRSMEFYFGDERYVPHDHKDSNFMMAADNLFAKVPVQDKQIHAIPTDCNNISDCADKYSEELRILPKINDRPCFDLVLLGIGDDGHTASLFPDTEILTEREKNVSSVFVEKFDSWRISMTYPVLDVAKQILVMVSGENKAQVLHEILEAKESNYPVQGINNPNGVLWYLDQAAASKLNI